MTDIDMEIVKHAEEGGAEKSQQYMTKWLIISIVVGLVIWLLPTPEALGTRGHAFLACWQRWSYFGQQKPFPSVSPQSG
jgi:hypothetical protein